MGCSSSGLWVLIEARTYEVASGLIYLAEALLFDACAVLIACDIYTYLQMPVLEVLNLIVYSITIGSHLMGFTQKTQRPVQAIADFGNLSRLDTEPRGSLLPQISETIRFNNVDFLYLKRPEVPVLKHMSLKIASGECGRRCDLWQRKVNNRLPPSNFKPNLGSVTIGDMDARLVDIRHLRYRVSVVSQPPHLFDITIADNRRYDHPWISDVDVRYPAQAANIHDFIMTLPHGYDTVVNK